MIGKTTRLLPGNEEPALRGVLLYAGAAIFLTILAPFSTDDDFSIPVRLFYWTCCIGGGAVLVRTTLRLIERLADAPRGSRIERALPAKVVIAAVPVTLLVAVLEAWLREAPAWMDFARLYPLVLSIVVVMTLVSWLVRQSAGLSGQATAVPAQDGKFPLASRTPFHERLDAERRADEIVMLRADDHYLHVTTSNGTQTIRCNLSTAIRELASTGGQRVHRSYWIARSAVVSVRKHGHAYRLVTHGGRSIPLSRRRHAELVRKNWLPTC